jgi:hypothetical protein
MSLLRKGFYHLGCGVKPRNDKPLIRGLFMKDTFMSVAPKFILFQIFEMFNLTRLRGGIELARECNELGNSWVGLIGV